jgi:Meckel syndrome type 1 protein
MSASAVPPKPDLSESATSELQALYREAATEEPGPLLDRAILAAARDELQPAVAPRRQTPRWRNWFAATSAIAVAVLGLSLTLRVMDEQERELREEISAGQSATESTSKALPADLPAAAKPASKAPKSVLDVPVAPSPEAAPAPARPPAAEPLAFPAAPPAMAPAPAPAQESMQKSRRAEADEARETTRDARAGSLAAPASALRKLDVLAPEAWLQQIRELHAAGRNAEAAQSLARFRGRYPDFVLPDDLANLK